MPDYIYCKQVKFTSANEIYSTIEKYFEEKKQYVPDIPPFLLKENCIFSFEPFDSDSNPINALQLKDYLKQNTYEWIKSEIKSKWIIELLNLSLKNKCFSRGFKYDKKRSRFFAKYNGGSLPERRWRAAKKESTRKLIFLQGEGRNQFYEHFGGRLKFIKLGAYFYLIIDPIRVITSDGENPVDHKSSTRFHTKKNMKYHNANYLYDVKFWVFLLSGSREEILLNTTNNPIIISTQPIKLNSAFGILEDQNVDNDFLDKLHSTPLEYEYSGESFPEDEENPLADTPMEG